MTYSKELMHHLHQLSFGNRHLVERATVCGCYHCGAIYSPDIIDPESDYCVDTPHDTATCPECWIDSVICDSMGVEVTPELLEEMHEEFFGDEGESLEIILPEAEEEEEPDEELKSVYFFEEGEFACRVILQSGITFLLERSALTETIGVRNEEKVPVRFACPYGSSIIMCLELPDGSGCIIKWNYRRGQLRVCEEGEERE